MGVYGVYDVVESVVQPRSVCANCMHVHLVHEADHHTAWLCRAVPERVIRPRAVHPITGEFEEEWTAAARCVDRNSNGDCGDFEAKSPPASVVQLRLSTVGDPYRAADESRACDSPPPRGLRQLLARLMTWLRARMA